MTQPTLKINENVAINNVYQLAKFYGYDYYFKLCPSIRNNKLKDLSLETRKVMKARILDLFYLNGGFTTKQTAKFFQKV